MPRKETKPNLKILPSAKVKILIHNLCYLEIPTKNFVKLIDSMKSLKMQKKVKWQEFQVRNYRTKLIRHKRRSSYKTLWL